MGNLVVGQSGGPTAVINSSLVGVIKGALHFGIPKIYGMKNGIEGFLQDRVLDLNELFPNAEGLALLKRTPSSFLGTCRYKLPPASGNEEVYEKVFERMEEYDISYFLYIGGNDSMDTIQQLSDYAATHHKPQKFIGIPKTIDNDLPATDHTPGYGSAAKFIATTTKEIIRDTESYESSGPKISVIEIMGRNAGWLTAASALSRSSDCVGPDLIYLPEVAFDPKAFLGHVSDITSKKASLVIAVSEGIRLADGTLVCESSGNATFVDPFGHTQLSGSGHVVANMISNELGYKTRAIELSILQRCATHLASRVDIDEAYNVGFEAVKSAIHGETGKMIVIEVVEREPYIAHYKAEDIHGIANEEKKLPLGWISPDKTDVTDDFMTYARPLIGGFLLPHFEGGIPKHTTLYGPDKN